MSEQKFTTPRPIRLEVAVAAGDLRVATIEGDQSTVTLDGSPKLLDETTAELIGDRLVIQQRHRSLLGIFGRSDQSLRITAEVPRQSSVQITTASAETRLDGTFDRLELKSASGGVILEGELEGNAEIKTVSGDVRLALVHGDLSAQSVSGDLMAQTVAGSASVKSVSGNLRIGSLHEGSVQVQSVSGDVDLGVASGTSIDVDAGSASGQLSSEVALSERPVQGSGPKLVIRGKTVSGDFRVFRAA